MTFKDYKKSTLTIISLAIFLLSIVSIVLGIVIVPIMVLFTNSESGGNIGGALAFLFILPPLIISAFISLTIYIISRTIDLEKITSNEQTKGSVNKSNGLFYSIFVFNALLVLAGSLSFVFIKDIFSMPLVIALLVSNFLVVFYTYKLNTNYLILISFILTLIFYYTSINWYLTPAYIILISFLIQLTFLTMAFIKNYYFNK